MKRLDGYLSNRAQYQIDPTSLIYELDGRFVLERDGQEPLDLGESFTNAQQAVQSLARAKKASSVDGGA